MLAVFPELLAFGLVAPLILRVVAGLLFIALGWPMFGKRREEWSLAVRAAGLKPTLFWTNVVGLIKVIGGALLIVGFWTQVTALVLTVLMLASVGVKFKNRDLLPWSLGYYSIMLAVMVSLIFSGAGFFAVDLPL